MQRGTDWQGVAWKGFCFLWGGAGGRGREGAEEGKGARGVRGQNSREGDKRREREQTKGRGAGGMKEGGVATDGAEI